MRFVRSGLVLAGFCFGLSGCAAVNNPSSATATDAITIDALAINGAQSFAPNPTGVPAGQMVVWHNVDSQTHRIVLDDRSVDTGKLAPGATSAPMPIGGPGRYHCAIHPEMVGIIIR